MEMAVEQNSAAKIEFQTKMDNVLKENDRLLTHALGVDIVNIVVNDYMNVNCLNVDDCEHRVTTESELKTYFIKKENYETLLKQYHSLEKHCISLEINNQLNTEIFQRDNVSSSESALTFAELIEINELKAKIQVKDTVIAKLKEKIKSSNADDKERKIESKVVEIETQNLELDHRVTKLIVENNHLKQTYKQLFDSIKSSRVQSKEQSDDLINKVNIKSVEVADLNASLWEKVLVIATLKEQLSKLKGKAVLTDVVSLNPIDPTLLQVDVVLLVPKLRKNRTAHVYYIKHTLEETATLRELVESERLLSLLNTPLDYACKYTRWIQELLMILQQTCPRITDLGTKLVAVTPKNQTKQVRCTPKIPKSEKTSVSTSPSPDIDSNAPVISSTGVALVSSASGSQSKDNTKKAKETKLEDHHRKVKSSVNKASVVDSRASSSVIKSVSNVNSNLKCASCNGCLFSNNHDKCVVEYINSVNASRKSKSTKNQLIGRIATATIVHPREPITIVQSTDKPVVTLVYTRKPKAKHAHNNV
nr:hypothetical protein [Tanacetum cinerariifolium]GFB20259.1 hypothetical protein [Tanacetum cinerariifolium]